MTQLPRRALTGVAAIVCFGVGFALAGENKADKTPLTNVSFVTKSAQANMAEVELSKLALQKSQDEQVRAFAQRMVQDHGKAGAELKTLAQKHGIQVPAQLDAKHAQKLEKLRGKEDAEFDAEYSKAMMKGHEKALSLFTDASKAKQLNPDLQAFASKTLPTLQTHHRLANRLPGAAETRSAQSEAESSTSR